MAHAGFIARMAMDPRIVAGVGEAVAYGVAAWLLWRRGEAGVARCYVGIAATRLVATFE